jgi:hypothetical protein
MPHHVANILELLPQRLHALLPHPRSSNGLRTFPRRPHLSNTGLGFIFFKDAWGLGSEMRPCLSAAAACPRKFVLPAHVYNTIPVVIMLRHLTCFSVSSSVEISFTASHVRL